MRALRHIVPAAVLLALALLVAVPWPLPIADRLLLPLLPLALVHFCLMRRRVAMPAPLAFTTGLTLDSLSQGPLGFWALLYVLGWAGAAAFSRTFVARGGLLASWLSFALLAGGLAALALVLSSALLGDLTDPARFARALRLPLAAYPLVAAIGWLLTESTVPPRAWRLERSG